MEALRNASSCATGSAATHCLKVLDSWVGLFWLKRFPWWSERPLSVLLLWGVVCGWSAARGDQRLEGRFHCQVTWDDRHSLLLSERGEAWSPLFHLDSLLRNKKVDVLRLFLCFPCLQLHPLCTRSDHLRLWRTRAAHTGVEVVMVSA